MRFPLSVIAAAVLCGGSVALAEPGIPLPTPAPETPSDADTVTAARGVVLLGAPTVRAPSAAEVREMRVGRAIDALLANVAPLSHPDGLRYAFRAYYAYRDAHPDRVRKPYLYFVDYGLDSRTPRGYVFDMDALALVDGPFMVAHGRGSAAGRDGVPARFSNRNGSNATSLGLYLAQETYAFRGKSGGRSYRSVGLRLQGLSGRFNSAARKRGVVVHGAPYVTEDRAGRSEGCPAMDPERARRLIPLLSNGGMVFHFSPRDSAWMRTDPWVGSPVPEIATIAE